MYGCTNFFVGRGIFTLINAGMAQGKGGSERFPSGLMSTGPKTAESWILPDEMQE